jgi:hypothetical protein
MRTVGCTSCEPMIHVYHLDLRTSDLCLCRTCIAASQLVLFEEQILLCHMSVVYSFPSAVTSIYPSLMFYDTPDNVLPGLHQANLASTVLDICYHRLMMHHYLCRKLL